LLLCDTDKSLGKAYGAARPIGGPARISYLIGPDGAIVRTYGKVKPADHPGQVLDDLADLKK
jgi:peroxiredoxin